MTVKRKLTTEEYLVLFGRVREAIKGWSDKTLREKLLYHWNNSPLEEMKAVVDDMLELGTLEYPTKK